MCRKLFRHCASFFSGNMLFGWKGEDMFHEVMIMKVEENWIDKIMGN